MDRDLQSVQEARDLIERAYRAFLEYQSFSQERVDAIVGAMAAAATAQAEPLARLAVEETTYGRVEDKIQKNLFASRRVYEAIRGMRTVGVMREDAEAGLLEIATPVGVVVAILPCTNPTSTAIYKILIALKAGNAIVVSPHPAAMRCICAAVGAMSQAARATGAPEGLIGCFSTPTLAGTQELMRHRRTGVILATGGMSIVRAAYSSGKPAFGVGPGNVPAYIDRSADLAKAVADVVFGKTFDWGTICSSEQAIVAEEALRSAVTEELHRQGAQFLAAEEIRKLGDKLILSETFTVNPKCVGQSPQKLGELAGVSVSPKTRVLVAELADLGREHPLSAEKLSPVLALYFRPDREAAFERCAQLLRFGGLGHTCVIHARDDAVVRAFGLRMPAFRVVVNSPAPQGSIGDTTNLFPAMTLGCGAAGGNITSDNIGPQHLLNVKRVAYEKRAVAAAAAACGCPHAVASDAAPPSFAAQRPTPVPPVPPLARVAADPPAPGAYAGLDRAAVRAVVERFLAEKLGAVPAAQRPPDPAPVPASALAPIPATAARPPAAISAEPAANPANTLPRPAEFVSEAEVRAAVQAGRKIFISPRSIVTPAARDLGEAHGVFEVVAAAAAATPKSSGE